MLDLNCTAIQEKSACCPPPPLLLSTTRTLPSRGPVFAIIAGVLQGSATCLALSPRTHSPPPSPHPRTAPRTTSSVIRARGPATTAPSSPGTPGTLGRPPFTRDALLAAEFIRHGLRAKAPQMLAGTAALAPSHLPTSLPWLHLAAALSVPLRASPGPNTVPYPTHALAIAPVSRQGRGARGGARHLSRARGSSGRALREAPAPAAVCTRGPSRTAHAFPILHVFMNTHRLGPALAAFLPLPPAFLSSSPPNSRSSHGEELTALMGHAGHVKELWQDVVALGADEPDALDLAWRWCWGR
ncbi:hypothetical protein DFH09DRAFT_1362187 [Mycena vulgaris]|nr:hypothetical protein DFH09DRAFT_1362187 [Mycena vulgaris]